MVIALSVGSLCAGLRQGGVSIGSPYSIGFAMTSTNVETDPTRGWRPRATLETLRARARFFATLRAFFSRRGVMEVDTPLLSRAAAVDPNVESLGAPELGWLHTSPEFFMKRLLAAGSGPIYQIAHVFRAEEIGRYHQREFTMLEWYRPGFASRELMDEVEAVVQAVGGPAGHYPRISYRNAFQRHANIEVFDDSLAVLRARVAKAGVEFAVAPDDADLNNRDFWLDLAMSTLVSPRLGAELPCFVYDYPASQAALAALRPGRVPVAERFELFWRGVELANGFHELRDAEEQRTRFGRDLATRAVRGQRQLPMDEHFLAALRYGLPDCSGVALGLDRLLMLLLNLGMVADAQSFDGERA